MMTYEVRNMKTDEEKTLFGYNYADACKRANVEADEWKVVYSEFVD
jgi:hypothetical protein